ncbi:acyltransferase domain-containing protein [Thermostaphylospora chromogena]
MGVELLASSEVFAERFGECAEALAPFVDVPLAEALGDAAALARVDVVQPVSFAVMVALAAVWESLGVVPDAVVGHSQGEIAAAVVAGALSVRDGARVVALRSRVIAERLAGGGGMVSVGLPVERVVERIGGRWRGVEVAVVNGPGSVVVAGPVEAVEAVVADCEREGVWARRVEVDYARTVRRWRRFGGSCCGCWRGWCRMCRGCRCCRRWTVEWVRGPLDGEYWYRNLRRPVRFDRRYAH